jgi:hypothetical protein
VRDINRESLRLPEGERRLVLGNSAAIQGPEAGVEGLVLARAWEPINRHVAAWLLQIESRGIICDFVRLSDRCCYRNACALAWPEGVSDRLHRSA